MILQSDMPRSGLGETVKVTEEALQAAAEHVGIEQVLPGAFANRDIDR